MNKALSFTTLFFYFLSPICATDEIMKISSTNNLRRRVMVTITDDSDNNEKIDVDETMKIYDNDNDGFLSYNEFEIFCYHHPLCPSTLHLDVPKFDRDDDDDDGKISKEAEMGWIKKSIIESHRYDDEQIYKLTDANEDDKISYKELVWMTKYIDHTYKKFQIEDKDGNGYITMDEIATSKICSDEISCYFLMNPFDRDHDGKINFTDYLFKELIMNMTANSLESWSFQQALSMLPLEIEETNM